MMMKHSLDGSSWAADAILRVKFRCGCAFSNLSRRMFGWICARVCTDYRVEFHIPSYKMVVNENLILKKKMKSCTHGSEPVTVAPSQNSNNTMQLVLLFFSKMKKFMRRFAPNELGNI